MVSKNSSWQSRTVWDVILLALVLFISPSCSQDVGSRVHEYDCYYVVDTTVPQKNIVKGARSLGWSPSSRKEDNYIAIKVSPGTKYTSDIDAFNAVGKALGFKYLQTCGIRGMNDD